MELDIQTGWSDYQLLDSGDGFRIESFGKYIIKRPDPQCFWKRSNPQIWEQCDAEYLPSDTQYGVWHKKPNMPDAFDIRWDKFKFRCKLTAFKHTGIFPEQCGQWTFLLDKFKEKNQSFKALNLFAYTGVSTVVLAACGIPVTHVDASRSALNWASENLKASGLATAPVKWMHEDVLNYVTREVKRGNKYDIILCDPPAYGHGTHGEVWDFMKDIQKLIPMLKKISAENGALVLINAYAVSISSLTLGRLLADVFNTDTVKSGELVLKEKSSDKLLSTGLFAKWDGLAL